MHVLYDNMKDDGMGMEGLVVLVIYKNRLEYITNTSKFPIVCDTSYHSTQFPLMNSVHNIANSFRYPNVRDGRVIAHDHFFETRFYFSTVWGVVITHSLYLSCAIWGA